MENNTAAIEKDIVTKTHWTDRLRAAVTAKAKAAGCESPEMLYCTIDRTWGDKMGMLFIGPDAERAAHFAAKWISKNVKGSYDQQNVAGYCGVKEVKTHSEAHGTRYLTGHVVSAVYYPCAD